MILRSGNQLCDSMSKQASTSMTAETEFPELGRFWKWLVVALLILPIAMVAQLVLSLGA